MTTRRGGYQGGNSGGYQGGNQGGGGQRQGGGGGKSKGTRHGVLTGWINPDEKTQEVFQALADANFRLIPQEGVEIFIDGNQYKGDLRLFRNDNDKGAGPHVNVVGYVD